MTSRPVLVGTAFLLGAAGLALLFAPGEVLSLLGVEGTSRVIAVLAQLLGSAWLGLAYGNWIARGLAIGGIHGRAIVIGNLVHATTAALVLARGALEGARPAVWVFVVLLGIVAGAFGRLLRTAPRAPLPS
ncbi:MAG: hypothetical protein ACM357_00570 [Gemmatimonadota bacterium]